MPSKKKKYNSRFPPARIKKIMQTDEDIGKVAAAVPVLISKCLEMFLASLLTKAGEITDSKRAKTMSRTHLKQCILSESMFDFLKDHVANIPDIQNEEEASGSTSFPVEKDTTKKVVRKRSLSKPKKTPKKRLRLGHEESEEDSDAAEDASENGSGNEGSDASFSSPGLLISSVQKNLESQSSVPHVESSDVVPLDKKSSIHIPLDILMSNDEIPASVKIDKPIVTRKASAKMQTNIETEREPELQTTTLIKTVDVKASSSIQGSNDSPARKGVIVANTAAYKQPSYSLSLTNAQKTANVEPTLRLGQNEDQCKLDAGIRKKVGKEVPTPTLSDPDGSAQNTIPSINPQRGSMLSLLYSSVPMSPLQIPPTVQQAPSGIHLQEKYAYSPLTQHRFSEPRQPLLHHTAPQASSGGQGSSGYPCQFAPYTPISTQRHYLGYPQSILTPPSHHASSINSHMVAHPSLIQVKPAPRTRSDDDDYDT